MSAAGRPICSPESTSPSPPRGRLPNDGRAAEKEEMDPDLDQNQQHWQDRLDSFQWEVMSIVSQLDSVPT